MVLGAVPRQHVNVSNKSASQKSSDDTEEFLSLTLVVSHLN